MMLISPLNFDAIFSCACYGILYYGDHIFEDFFSRRLGGEDIIFWTSPAGHAICICKFWVLGRFRDSY
jgi:hypothetical protein